jgi:hypothetical protein
MTAALCIAATCSAVSSTSTGELHERVCAPFTITAAATVPTGCIVGYERLA